MEIGSMAVEFAAVTAASHFGPNHTTRGSQKMEEELGLTVEKETTHEKGILVEKVGFDLRLESGLVMG
ncbi:unnamed protein product [Linum trigynum]|uniref:Uncharacterized protein n=1 Tax=Linum trigynum TaxID=586398 RepID=A0AAV2G7V7_9ROSI